jgi:hypothetical protein
MNSEDAVDDTPAFTKAHQVSIKNQMRRSHLMRDEGIQYPTVYQSAKNYLETFCTICLLTIFLSVFALFKVIRLLPIPERWKYLFQTPL